MGSFDKRRWNITFAVLAVAAFVAALHGSEFHAWMLFDRDSWRSAGSFLEDWWPPRSDGEFIKELSLGVGTTVAIAFLGTAMAVTIALPLALFGSRITMAGALYSSGDARLSAPMALILLAARAISAFFRSVPEVLWALVFVQVYGLGKVPAIAAIGVAYGGMLAKVYSEQLESVDRLVVSAIESTGASRLATAIWGTVPAAFGSMADYTMYRFECAIRASVLMGFVGAGGIGQSLQAAYVFGQYADVCSATIILVALVAFVEAAADRLRRWIA